MRVLRLLLESVHVSPLLYPSPTPPVDLFSCWGTFRASPLSTLQTRGCEHCPSSLRAVWEKFSGAGTAPW